MGFNDLIFQLDITEDMMEFVNIAKTVSDDQVEEEVRLEIQSYRDHIHSEEVGAKMKEFFLFIEQASSLKLNTMINFIFKVSIWKNTIRKNGQFSVRY
jgi:hypothetical protein